MATPLAQLVHDVMHDPDVQAQFATAPESFLAEHGHEHLDAADLREAFFVLADGSAPAEASALQTGARAMGDDDLDGGSAASGLAGALSAILGTVFDVELGADPAALDDDDGDFDGTDDHGSASDEPDLDADLDADPVSGRQASRTAAEEGGGSHEGDGIDDGTDRAILYADDVDQPGTSGDDASSLGGATGAGIDAGVDTGLDAGETIADIDDAVDALAGLPEIDLAPLSDDGAPLPSEPIVDDGDGWDDVI